MTNIYQQPGAAAQQPQQQNQMLQILQQMPPEDRAAFLQDFAGQSGMLDQQMQQAQALRDRPTGGGVQAGNVFVAQSPLSSVAQGMNAYQAKKLRDDAVKQQKAMIAEKNRLMGNLGEGIVGQPKPERQIGGQGSASGYGSARNMRA